jgi:lipoprotein signal peptidase
MLGFNEPFTRLLNQGMVLMDGSAMSKSRGNLVRLSDELENHGVDAIRLSMVFAGALGNYIDRVRFQYVIDFLDFHYKQVWSYPAFNVADSFISIGVALILYDAFKNKKPLLS